MKKLTLALTTGLFLLAFAGNVMAATNVSEMVTEKGGQAVAECAIMMDKGVSECVSMTVCNQ